MGSCASNYENGFGGYVLFGQYSVAGTIPIATRFDVTDWMLKWDQELYETTTTSDTSLSLYGPYAAGTNACAAPILTGWKSFIGGANNFTGSCKSFWDNYNPPTVYNQHAGLVPLVPTWCPVTIVLNIGQSCPVPVGSTVTTVVAQDRYQAFMGTVFITSMDIDNVVKGVVAFNIEFQGTGALQYYPS